MLKKVILVACLLAAGVAMAVYLHAGRTSGPGEVAFNPDAGASAETRIGELERALAAQIERGRVLGERLAQLEARLGEGGSRRGDTERGPNDEQLAALRERFDGGLGADGRPDPAAMRERMRERQSQRLVDAGFSSERAEWIQRRTEELEVQAMQARYEAQRSGQPLQNPLDPQRALRKEMGDSEYERYLDATGQPTEVRVMNVLASSAAERSGLQPGDEIVSYGGTRVFDIRELSALTNEGTSGNAVTVEVKRNGQSVQLQVPAGPLGITGGGMRGPPGGPAGGPGGFRGGG